MEVGHRWARIQGRRKEMGGDMRVEMELLATDWDTPGRRHSKFHWPTAGHQHTPAIRQSAG